jgi:uncharacterized protein YdiU (UPF0061 family)
VFSSIDHDGRYAWANQPAIAHWNLSRLAETLLPLLDDDADRAGALAMTAIRKFDTHLSAHWSALLRSKVGLPDGADAADRLATEFLHLLQLYEVDYTLGWRRLGDAAAGNEAPLRALFGEHAAALDDWLARWRAMFGTVPGAERARAMGKVNPMVIPRNHQVELALEAATDYDDLAPFERLLDEVRRPFDPRDDDNVYIQPAPREQTANYRTFCGT